MFDRLALRAHGGGQSAGGDAGDFRLARGINVGQPEAVRAMNTTGELAREMQRAGETMGLEGDQQAGSAQPFRAARVASISRG